MQIQFNYEFNKDLNRWEMYLDYKLEDGTHRNVRQDIPVYGLEDPVFILSGLKRMVEFLNASLNA